MAISIIRLHGGKLQEPFTATPPEPTFPAQCPVLPRPQITWHTHQGHAVDSQSGAAVAKGTSATTSGKGGSGDVLVASATPYGLRRVLQDGTLVFRAFGEREYAADVHHATYRCSATNGVGTIVSRDVKVRAEGMLDRAKQAGKSARHQQGGSGEAHPLALPPPLPRSGHSLGRKTMLEPGLREGGERVWL
ncbi:hypothetical protein HPB49_006297 [Dermacentor silvarum]|uniref:Uncharacterized protein n=1 Tax=Dermacentor silvarum TaxID=543639 RepID=A0ACB8CVR8_DERSI|nr:hypothetical protein HPB49_006297 [Dermacentor silvarum]